MRTLITGLLLPHVPLGGVLRLSATPTVLGNGKKMATPLGRGLRGGDASLRRN